MQRLFISYARADGREFALRLRDDVTAEGFDAWMDDRMGAGALFDAEIEQRIESRDAVLAVMTHGSQRGASVSRDEVVYALNCDPPVPVIPLRTAQDVRPMLMLGRRNWVDFSRGYEAGLDQLLAHLRGDADVLAQPLGPAAAMEALDFGPDLARLTRDFTGREWVVDELDVWLNDSPKQAMAIIGGPGIGKSAIVAWLAETRGEQIAAIYLCNASIPGSLDPHRFVDTVVAQLGARLPEYARLVPALEAERRPASAADAFRELVVRPLQALEGEREALLLVVDSLDEAERQAGETILDVLEANLDGLPAWLRVITTTRPDQAVFQRMRRLGWFELDADRPENQEDLRRFAQGRLAEERLAGRLTDAGADPEEVLAEVERISAGNFLIANRLLNALAAGDASPSDLSAMAPELHSLFYGLFRHWSSSIDDFEAHYLPLLGALAVAVEPLPLEVGAAVLGCEPRIARQRILRIGQVLQERAGCWVLFHRTLRDWLCDPNLAAAYWCDPEEAHERLSQVLWDEYGRGALGEYGVRSLPRHLAEAKRWEQFDEIIGSPEFLSARLRSARRCMIDEPTRGAPADLGDEDSSCAVFICSASEDYRHAHHAYSFLRSLNSRVFFAPVTLGEHGRSDWVTAIDEALEDAKHMIVVASDRDHFDKPNVSYEWTTFTNEMNSGRKEKGANVVTLAVGALGPQDLPIRLRQHELLRLSEDGLERLLDYVREELLDE